MMQLITFFLLLFFGSVFLKAFHLFNEFMDEQNGGKSFFQEIKEYLFRKEMK